MAEESLTNAQKDALNAIKRADWGYQTRVPISFLLEFANKRSVETIVARTAIKMELDALIASSTTNTEVIEARLGRQRLSLVLEEVLNRLEDIEAVYK